jgi:hypothetical protein
MTNPISRRDLFTKKILSLFQEADSGGTQPGHDRRRESLEDYFKSPLLSYPLLQEMPWDLLIAEAESRGIPVEGRSKNDIARDLFMKFSGTT